MKIAQEAIEILYFDRDSGRGSKNWRRLFAAETVNANGFTLVPVGRAKDMYDEKGATTLVEQKPYAAYIIQYGSDGCYDVLTSILLAASERKERPKIGVITPNGDLSIIDEIKEEASSLGVEALIQPLHCHPNGFFSDKDDAYALKGRETVMRMLKE